MDEALTLVIPDSFDEKNCTKIFTDNNSMTTRKETIHGKDYHFIKLKTKSGNGNKEIKKYTISACYAL